MREDPAAGDEIPANCEVIEVSVTDLRQLFNSIDPSPFRERDLDPKMEEFILEWSREVPNDVPLALRVRVDRPAESADSADEAAVLRTAVHQYFAGRSDSSRRRLSRLFHTGRISLVIGIAALTGFTIAAEFIPRWTGTGGLGSVVHESLLIGGWVAMWRPLEVFLYDWWPIRAERRLFDRLAKMPVRISYTAA